MQHSSAEAIEGAERPVPTEVESGSGIQSQPARAADADDAMYPSSNKESADHDSLRKRDIESNESDVKGVRLQEEEAVEGEEEENGKMKQWVAAHAKAIRVGIHIAIGVVMTA
jgi:hypothetical protein